MTLEPTPEHEAFLEELKAALGNSGKDLPAEHLLAIAAQFVGMLVALQDQRRYTASAVLDIVARNIEVGNASAIETNLMHPQGRG